MDALTECRFLLNLLETAKTLVTGYGGTAPPAPTLTVKGFIRVNTQVTVTDDAFLGLLFKKIYNEPFPGRDSDDPRVIDLATAFNNMPRT